jgi:hypothetical protein
VGPIASEGIDRGEIEALHVDLLNSGVREQEACKLEWDWEAQCAELGVSAFVVPAGASLRNLDGNTPCKGRRLERWCAPHCPGRAAPDSSAQRR